MTIPHLKLSNLIFNDVNYHKFLVSRPNIFNEIANNLKENILGISSDELSKNLSAKEPYIRQLLNVWCKCWCSFFEYGRIGYSVRLNKWFYLSNTHPCARKHIIKISYIRL